jgi:hypothetical protein
VIIMLIVSVCSDHKPFSPAGRPIDKSTIFLGKRVDILREGIPRQYRSDDDEQQRPARQEEVSKETLEKPLVIGGIGLENARGGQNDGGQHSWRLPGCSAEEAAPLGCGPIQIPVNNKNPEPDEGGSCDCFRASEECLLHRHILLSKASGLPLLTRRARDREIDRIRVFF